MKRRTLLQTTCAAVAAPFVAPAGIVAVDASTQVDLKSLGIDGDTYSKTFICSHRGRYLFWDSTGIPNKGDSWSDSCPEWRCISHEWSAITMDSEGDHTYECKVTYTKHA